MTSQKARSIMNNQMGASFIESYFGKSLADLSDKFCIQTAKELVEEMDVVSDFNAKYEHDAPSNNYCDIY